MTPAERLAAIEALCDRREGEWLSAHHRDGEARDAVLRLLHDVRIALTATETEADR